MYPHRNYASIPTPLPPFDEKSEVSKLDVYSVYSRLLTLIKPPQSVWSGREVPNWLLKEYAEFLANPVCNILSSSFEEQALPESWKYANITPLSKTKPVSIIAKHIRPISLTSALSKLAEDFIVKNYVGPAVLEIIDPNQFVAIPKSSTTQAFISMMHAWTSATDGTGAAVRIILLDYKKPLI